MGAFKDKIIKELVDNEQYDLADIISDIETDVDVANYLSANRGYYSKMYTTPDLELMPEFRKAMYSDLKTGIVDYDKEFGEGWYKNYGDIPSDQIKFVADKQGVSYKDLVHKMAEEATKRQRHDIVHDGTISGYITEFVAPRSVEAIERGESPSVTDAGLDIAQNIAYAVPWATGTAPILARLGATGIVGKVIQGAAGNALTPVIMETADAAAYDSENDEDKSRGNWSGSDVLTETMINASTPWILRNLLKSAGKFTTGKGAEFVNKWEQFGAQRPTRESMFDDLSRTRTNEHVKNEMANMADYAVNPPMSTRAASLNYTQQDLNRMAMADKLTEYAKELEIARKTKGAVKPSIKFTDDEIMFISKDPELSKYLNMDINYPELPSLIDLASEEAYKNYFTNQFGSYWYDEQSPWTRIPVVGSRIEQAFKEQEKEQEKQAVKDSILYELMQKNLLHK